MEFTQNTESAMQVASWFRQIAECNQPKGNLRPLEAREGGTPMSTYLHGQLIAVTHDYFEHPSVEALHRIRKLRWIGMEEEAEQLQMKIQEAAPTGGVITGARETD
jgi:hypothetical protein